MTTNPHPLDVALGVYLKERVLIARYAKHTEREDDLVYLSHAGFQLYQAVKTYREEEKGDG